MNASNSETTSLTKKMLMTEKMLTEKESTSSLEEKEKMKAIHNRCNN
jgi:hypothetical protein